MEIVTVKQNDAFSLGRRAGFQAGLRAETDPPKAPVFHRQDYPDFEKDFAQGAAIGFQRGHIRRLENEDRIRDQLERDDIDLER